MKGWARIGWACMVPAAGCLAPGVVCGDGTKEQDGICVPVDDAGTTDADTTTSLGDDDADDVYLGDFAVEPPALDFGTLWVPCEDTATLTVTNTGPDRRRIDVIEVSPQRAFAIVPPDALPLRLGPGDAVEIVVRVTPTEVGPIAGTLTLISDDPAGDAVVALTAEAEVETGHEELTVPGPLVDVLFAIDHSCSMEDDNADDIEAGIWPFLDALTAVSDWEMIQVTRENGCANGGVLTAATPNAEQLLIDHAWDGGSIFGGTYLTEALLELSALALDLRDPGECNEAFGRPGAQLHVIVASDEPEQSGRPYTDWLATYANHVDSPELVKVSAIVDINNACGYGSAGYRDAALATGGTLLDICNSSWGQDMSQLADVIEQTASVFVLDQPAVDGTVVVTVDGQPADFTYDADQSTVTLVDLWPEGSVVVIDYHVATVCDG
jgi:hypothetical protein